MLPVLIDENLDQRILRGLRLQVPNLNYVIVQETELRSSGDPALLAWAAEQRRVVVTHDVNTIPKYATSAFGWESPSLASSSSPRI